MGTLESSVRAHTLKIHTHTCFLGFWSSILGAQNIILWCGLAPRPLGMSKDI